MLQASGGGAANDGKTLYSKLRKPLPKAAVGRRSPPPQSHCSNWPCQNFLLITCKVVWASKVPVSKLRNLVTGSSDSSNPLGEALADALGPMRPQQASKHGKTPLGFRLPYLGKALWKGHIHKGSITQMIPLSPSSLSATSTASPMTSPDELKPAVRWKKITRSVPGILTTTSWIVAPNWP